MGVGGEERALRWSKEAAAGRRGGLAVCLAGRSPKNLNSKESFEFNPPPGLWKRKKGKGKQVRSLERKELFVLKNYLLGLSPIFWFCSGLKGEVLYHP